MTDNCKVNEFVRLYLRTAKEKNMADFYLLHERFDRLSENEKASALLDIIFFKEISKGCSNNG